MEVPVPDGAQEYPFYFYKPDSHRCRSTLLTTIRDQNEHPRSIDEPPRYVENAATGTTPAERYIRRSVTYLARLLSVTQSCDKGLALTVYVRLDTKEWLRMYSGLCNLCDFQSCLHLPDPVMLTAAALVESDADVVVSEATTYETRANTMKSISDLRNELGFGGRPDAVPVRSQTTLLCMDFDILARNRSTTHTLWESLRNKGWNDLHRITPDYSGNFGFRCVSAR